MSPRRSSSSPRAPGSIPWSALLLAAASAVHAQTGVTHERVAGDVWRIDGAVDVLLVQTGPDGTLLVDTGYPFAEAGVKRALAEIAGDTAVTRLILTHSHHGFASHLYGRSAEIVAHERAAARIAGGFPMAGRAMPAAGPAAVPDRTFGDSLRIRMNGEDVTLIHLPSAHTDGDVAVFFHRSNVVATGDVFVPHMPWVSVDEGGTVDGLLAGLDQLLERTPEDARIVAGHDPGTRTKDEIRRFRAMVEAADRTVRARMAAGLPLRAIQALGLPGLGEWEGAVPTSMFIESLYRSSTPVRAVPGSPTLELVGGRWWDGSGFVDRTVYVVDGVFAKRRPRRVDARLDLEGGWVVPPLAEAHTHRFGDVGALAEDAEAFLSEGVFYAMVQDPMAAVGPGHRTASDAVEAPDVAYTQGALTPSWGAITEMYGTLASAGRFGPNVTLDSLDGDLLFVVDDADQVDAAWSAIRARNPRFLKVIVAFSDEIDARRGDPERYPFRLAPPRTSAKAGVTAAVLRSVVRKAREAGLRVSAHIETAADFRLAADAGADWIAHMPAAWQIGEGTGYGPSETAPWLLSAEDARAAREAGAVVITTVSGTEDHPRAGLFREVHRQNLERLVAAGVPLAIGSDRFEGSVVDEALYLRSLGVLSDAQILTLLATHTPRHIFPERRIGHLRPGYEASFLVLGSDPTADLAALRDVRMAAKRGRILDR